MKNHPPTPSSRHYEDLEGLDEEHILHIHQQIWKKLPKHCGNWELTGYRSPSKVLPSIHHGREGIKRDRVNKVAPKFLRKRIKQQDKEKLNKNGYNKNT